MQLKEIQYMLLKKKCSICKKITCKITPPLTNPSKIKTAINKKKTFTQPNSKKNYYFFYSTRALLFFKIALQIL